MHHNFKPQFASFAHNVIGFPGVVLKWHEEGNTVAGEYITIKGLVKSWTFKRSHGGSVDFRNEIPRFNDWVRDTYLNDASVQG